MVKQFVIAFPFISLYHAANNLSEPCISPSIYVLCLEWRCSFPDDEISEGGRRPGNVTSLTDGQAVEYYCDAGYDMIGENRAVCNGSTFQPREFTPPRCERTFHIFLERNKPHLKFMIWADQV